MKPQFDVPAPQTRHAGPPQPRRWNANRWIPIRWIMAAIMACWMISVQAPLAHALELSENTGSNGGPTPHLSHSHSTPSGSESPPPQPVLPDTRLSPQRKVRRTRKEIQAEQRALRERTLREIDAIVAEFHGKLSREQAQAIGAFYARYSSRFQDSIADQIRALFEAAVAQGIFVPRENIFFDLGVRGSKNRRPGLDALRQAIDQKRFKVFMVLTTSRLYRKAYRAMTFVEEELVEQGIRVIFVKSQLDTDDGENWRTMLQLYATMDEAMARMGVAHIHASHEGLFIRGMVCSSLTLGFTGEVVPGELTRRNLPRQKIIIDKTVAEWIRTIFHWFVVDGKSRDEIARELNDDSLAPAPAKSLTGLWTALLVREHLMKPAYRGFLVYGKKKTVWLSRKDYATQKLRPEPLRSGQFEELRIISDELWYRAQELLAAEQSKSGRRSKDGDLQSRPRLLRGLFVCPEHDRQLVAGGPQGKILFCSLCRAIKVANRPLYSHLNRRLAIQLTCQRMAELVRADKSLVTAIIASCQQAAAAAQQPDPDVLSRLRALASRLSRSIEFNRRSPGDTDEEQRQTEQVLKDLRQQLNSVSAELAVHESAANREIIIPQPEEVIALLNELAEILISAASAETDEEMRVARRIIDDMTGGRIDLYQMGERKAQRGWLQGRFTVDVVSVAFSRLTGVRISVENAPTLEVVIDYRRPRLYDEQMEEAKRLWDQGLLNKVIARKMNRSEAYITMLIHRWFTSRGLPCPDGRKRRAEVVDKQVDTPVYKELADDVVPLVEQGYSNLEIARQFHTSDVTVGKAIKWWFTSRGLPVPTAADRRRSMLLRAKTMYESGRLLNDIAAELRYSPRGLKLALQSLYTELREDMPDGRTRRGHAAVGETANGRQRDDDFAATDEA